MDGLRQTQFETSIDVVEHDQRTPPSSIADALGVTAEMLHILRVRRERRTREPLMVTDAWLPTDLADTLTAVGAEAHTALRVALGRRCRHRPDAA